jgi:hypothetical protein
VRKIFPVALGLAIATGAAAAVVARIRKLERAATEGAPPPYDTPRNYIQHTDWDFEVEIAALPAFVPVSLRAPTTSPTQPVGDDARAVPVGTKIVLKDEEDRRIVLALRRRSAGGAERETRGG